MDAALKAAILAKYRGGSQLGEIRKMERAGLMGGSSEVKI